MVLWKSLVQPYLVIIPTIISQYLKQCLNNFLHNQNVNTNAWNSSQGPNKITPGYTHGHRSRPELAYSFRVRDRKQEGNHTNIQHPFKVIGHLLEISPPFSIQLKKYQNPWYQNVLLFLKFIQVGKRLL